MAAGGIKINISEEGSCFNWVEEVEREDPPSWWTSFEAKPVERPVRVKVKEVRLKQGGEAEEGDHLSLLCANRGLSGHEVGQGEWS